MNDMVTRRNRLNDLDRIFDSFFNYDSAPVSHRVPAVDITESDKGYEIIAELPGFNEGDLDIQVKENLLTLSASKMEDANGKEENSEVKVLKRERSSHDFKRSFYLPKDAKAEGIEAVFKNGLLTLSIAKQEEAKAQVIKVKAN